MARSERRVNSGLLTELGCLSKGVEFTFKIAPELFRVKFVVVTALLEQFAVGPDLDNLAFLDYEDPVSPSDR